MARRTAKPLHIAAQPDMAVPWRERPYLGLDIAGELLNRSRSGIYALAEERRLRLFKLAGRTLVPTEDVVRLLAEVQPFVPGANPRGRARQMRGRAA